MIDLKKELLRYKPVMEIDEIEKSINSNEIQDMIDLIKQVSGQKNITDKE